MTNPDREELVKLALSASERACYLRPDDTEQARACRAAYIDGARAYAAPPADSGMREALELAYGLLWIVGSDRSTTNGNALYLARKALYERISKDGQARGIIAARAAITDNPFHNLPDPVDTGVFPRTDNRPGDASASSGAGNHVAAVRDDGDAEGATSEAGLSTVERLWNPFQTCSTTDNRPVELRFQNGDVKHGYFSSSQRRWVDASGTPLEEGLYPSHWREALTAPGATTKSDGGLTLEMETRRADDNGRSCKHFCDALRLIASGAPDAVAIATAAIKMPWLLDEVGPSDPSPTRSDVTVESLAGFIYDSGFLTVRGDDDEEDLARALLETHEIRRKL